MTLHVTLLAASTHNRWDGPLTKEGHWLASAQSHILNTSFSTMLSGSEKPCVETTQYFCESDRTTVIYPEILGFTNEPELAQTLRRVHDNALLGSLGSLRKQKMVARALDEWATQARMILTMGTLGERNQSVFICTYNFMIAQLTRELLIHYGQHQSEFEDIFQNEKLRPACGYTLVLDEDTHYLIAFSKVIMPIVH